MKIETSPLFAEGNAFMNMDISMSGVVNTDSEWKQSPLYAPFSRLYFVTGGSGFLTSAEGDIEMKPGNVYFAPCGKKYGYYSTPSVSKLFFHVNLRVSQREGDAFQNCGEFACLPFPEEETEKLKSYYLSEDAGKQMVLKSEIFHTVCRFYQLLCSDKGKEKAFSASVIEAKTYIMSKLSAGLTVSEVARHSLCSVSKLCRLFKAEVGQSVSKYIDEMLMSKAKTLLIYSDLSIGQISERLGFCDQFYFSRKFSADFSVTPRDFRKNR